MTTLYFEVNLCQLLVFLLINFLCMRATPLLLLVKYHFCTANTLSHLLCLSPAEGL